MDSAATGSLEAGRDAVKHHVKMLRGHWPEAELEARQACEELQRFGLNDSVRAIDWR